MSGISIFHITRPSVVFFDGSQVKLNPKYSANIGVSTPTSESDKIEVYGDYFRQGGNNSFQCGLLYNHDFWVDEDIRKGIKGGLLYRWNDAVIPVLQLQLQDFAISASYDINVSQLVKASQYRGGVEITLSFKSFLNYRNNDLRPTRCPRFGATSRDIRRLNSGYIGY